MQVTTATVTSVEEDQARAARDSARATAFPALSPKPSAMQPHTEAHLGRSEAVVVGGWQTAAVRVPKSQEVERFPEPQAAFSPDECAMSPTTRIS